MCAPSGVAAEHSRLVRDKYEPDYAAHSKGDCAEDKYFL